MLLSSKKSSRFLFSRRFSLVFLAACSFVVVGLFSSVFSNNDNNLNLNLLLERDLSLKVVENSQEEEEEKIVVADPPLAKKPKEEEPSAIKSSSSVGGSSIDNKKEELVVQQLLVNSKDYIYDGKKDVVWDAAPIVIESHKLIFFTIPKVGCTVWKQLFRRMMGKRNWLLQDGNTLMPHNPRINGLKYLYHYPLAKANEIMTSPNWTRAIFVRDPKLRFLSAFLDKAVSNYGNFLREKCCPPPGPDDCVQQSQTLEGFLNLTLHSCENEHWKPQVERMESKYWPYINFVGHIENASEDAKLLLERIGAWDQYGKTGWGKTGNLSIFQSSDASSAGNHATWSQWAVWKWYTNKLERKVETMLYPDDYANERMNFTITNLVDY